MSDFINNDFQQPKQLRAQKTLQDIAESTEQLIRSGDIESVTTEKLSAMSGYSVGGIFHYFKKRDDIFVYVLMRRRQKKFAELAELIRAHSPQADITSFITAIINEAFGEFGKFKLKIIKFMLQIYFRRAQNPENFDTISQMLINDWMHAASQDQTGTFAHLDKDELSISM